MNELDQASASDSASKQDGHTSRIWTLVETEIAVEHMSAMLLECITLFYLGESVEALKIAEQLADMCPEAPSWCAYLAVHGLYWAGRIFIIEGRNDEARKCLQQAKSHKKYPFNITPKITTVLQELESGADGN